MLKKLCFLILILSIFSTHKALQSAAAAQLVDPKHTALLAAVRSRDLSALQENIYFEADLLEAALCLIVGHKNAPEIDALSLRTREEMLEIFLNKKGLGINAKTPRPYDDRFFLKQNVYGEETTLLMLSARYKPELVPFLLEKRADVNQKDYWGESGTCLCFSRS